MPKKKTAQWGAFVAQRKAFRGNWVDISIKTNELVENRDQTDLIAELHQLRTQLERAMVNAERYEKLRAWMTENGVYCLTTAEAYPTPEAIYGPTFEQAVDALPERDA